MLTQLSKELHSQGGVDEEEQHEEEAQVAHLWREMGGAGGQRPRGIHEEKGESWGGAQSGEEEESQAWRGAGKRIPGAGG